MSPSGSVDQVQIDHLALHDRPSITTLPATKRAGRDALKSAGSHRTTSTSQKSTIASRSPKFWPLRISV